MKIESFLSLCQEYDFFILDAENISELNKIIVYMYQKCYCFLAL